MFFWFKSKKIILDCFTDNSLIFDRHKPEKAVRAFPTWFKKINAKEEKGNLKHCYGFKEYFKNSIALRLGTMVNFKIDGDMERWEWISSRPIEVHEHPPEQFGYFLNSKYNHIKFTNPWRFKTNRFVQFAWVDSFWCRENHDYFFPHAVIDFYYQHHAAINMFFRTRGPSYKFEILPDDPLIFLIPISEHSVTIKTHLVSEQELMRYSAADAHGPKKYFVSKRIIDKMNEQKKCPFGFGK